MSFYLVSATPRSALMEDLHQRLARAEFRPMEPFGRALSHALENARRAPDGGAVWEEEDYCSPPLAEERAAVLDRYFDGLAAEKVAEGDGWRRIAALPALFPDLAERGGKSEEGQEDRLMAVEQDVARHYGTGGLIERIRAGLHQAGVDPDRARPADLKPVDEFHTGGMEATEALLAQLEIGPGTRVLDIGCGIGGTARAIAERHGARVTGVDLTPDYVAAAAELSRLVGLEDRVKFRTGSALALPVEDAGFDLALLLHVGMNIDDKQGLFREARRALAPGGAFALFEVMQGPRAERLEFPVPWASHPEASFVAPPAAYRDAARAAGFEVVAERDRTEFARAFFDKVMARIAAEGPPPLGIHLLMGETARAKIMNYVENLKAGRIAPTELICRVPS